MAVLSFENVTILQDGIPTLQNISLEMNEGDFAYLIGKTGSGKSTLFRSIYAELPIELGVAKVAGYSLNDIKRNDVPFLRRKLGFVFQDFQLLTDRNVEKNLSFVLEATGHTNPEEIRFRIEQVLAQVGMSNAIHKRVHRLSGGEQQRICIARAILNNPVLLLADEPTGHLDPEVSLEIMQLFKQLNQQGTAILMASHDYNTMRQIPGKFLKCEGGNIFPVDSI
ncbi:ATP-binding cassette domain-containing protein [Aquirufa nivalisilvae]|jgi:cell division transport system ATP-binding protein|uniref:Fe(3+)-transporting ATPase n=1 Tax=Aquirufa nivalisilvae TaxID=2516557 RepID=A0A2S2DWB5_9BACT|nr:ATP-binding cassette domain-containing protein [Aquirufa nivalisilvae]AWL09582.1 Fe(3+)-transporting ATPase [Aquirufa nivalisilvae]MCZ2480937.1 ATP-binding cassette domain-containing protein [Aquirufa nivalisilvae]MCZ2483754.1 ATP-binding cassette domain-containing protein [Aquirufa nivalisilvae]TBH74051.1 ATP-binding cassette domain-containing protein [Aquirufa nivalisilvae]